MSTGSFTLTRAQRLKMIRFSPIATGLLLAVVWFSVPSGLWSRLIAFELHTAPSNTYEAPLPPKDATEVATRYYLNVARERPEMTELLSDLDAAASKSWSTGLLSQGLMFSSSETVTVKPYAWPASSTALVPLSQFERRSGAKVYAWVLQPISDAPLVASAVTSEALLYPADRPRDLSLQTETLWRYWHGASPHEPMDWTAIPGAFASWADESRVVVAYTANDGPTWWLVYVVAPRTQAQHPIDAALPPELIPVKPESPHWKVTLDEVAQRRGYNVFVCGPLNLPAVPLRAPKGVSATQSAAFGKMVWPGNSRLFTGPAAIGIAELTGAEASTAGGRWAAVRARGIFGPTAREDTFGQSIMYAAVWKDLPVSPSGSSARITAIIAASSYLVFVLMVMIVFFIASAVASLVSLLLEPEADAPPRD
jgi:hypothetical protein